MDTTALIAGVSFLPVMIGMFGIGEVLNQIYEFKKSKEVEQLSMVKQVSSKLGRVTPTWAQFKRLIKTYGSCRC